MGVLTLSCEAPGQCVGHADLAGYVEMGINVGGYFDIGVFRLLPRKCGCPIFGFVTYLFDVAVDGQRILLQNLMDNHVG